MKLENVSVRVLTPDLDRRMHREQAAIARVAVTTENGACGTISVLRPTSHSHQGNPVTTITIRPRAQRAAKFLPYLEVFDHVTAILTLKITTLSF